MRAISVSPVRLLAGLIIGLVAGLVARGPTQEALASIAEPVGRLWLNALTMTVVPLVFSLLVTGIASASRGAAAGGTAMRTVIVFALFLTIACLSAAFLANGILHLWPASPGALPETGLSPLPVSAGKWYQNIIPENPLKAASETAMVPLVVFSLLLGFAVARLAEESAEALLRPLRAITDAMLTIVSWVLAVGPIGIAALAVSAGMALGPGVFGTLGQYVVIVAVCCLSVTVIAYVVAFAAGGTSPLRFARAALPAQAVAIGTQSSLASLPVMIRAADSLAIDQQTAAIVLPLAVSLFRAASGAANVAVAVYLAQIHGIGLGPGALVIAALVAVPVSLGAVGLPAQVSFFATIAPVCIAIGVPVTALPLLIAIEAIPDLFRTLGNVTCDIAACSAIGRHTHPVLR